MVPHLRVARPTDYLDTLATLYRDGLGLEWLGSFQDHDGFDGVMLGHPGAGWHLEFTSRGGEEAGRAPTDENILVLYYADPDEWQAACDRAEAAGFDAVVSHNPYWDVHGRTFEDPDGYRVVLQNSEWPVE